MLGMGERIQEKASWLEPTKNTAEDSLILFENMSVRCIARLVILKKNREVCVEYYLCTHDK